MLMDIRPEAGEASSIIDEAEGFEKSLLSNVFRVERGEERNSPEDPQVFT
jgi:hypothetical protein